MKLEKEFHINLYTVILATISVIKTFFTGICYFIWNSKGVENVLILCTILCVTIYSWWVSFTQQYTLITAYKEMIPIPFLQRRSNTLIFLYSFFLLICIPSNNSNTVIQVMILNFDPDFVIKVIDFPYSLSLQLVSFDFSREYSVSTSPLCNI